MKSGKNQQPTVKELNLVLLGAGNCNRVDLFHNLLNRNLALADNNSAGEFLPFPPTSFPQLL